MSLEVRIDDLRRHVEERGGLANLVSVGEDGAPHVVSVQVNLQGDDLCCSVGRRSRANLLHHPRLCLLWPAPAPAAAADGRYQLILDGDATDIPPPDPDGRTSLRIKIVSGILHLVAGIPDTPTCLPLTPQSPSPNP